MSDHETRQAQALLIIEDAIRDADTPPSKVEAPLLTLAEMVERLPPLDDVERFRKAVRRFVYGLRDIARDYVDDDVSGWLHAVKPPLRALVGWDAITPLGRAADSEGYSMLHARWNEEWDRASARKAARERGPIE